MDIDYRPPTAPLVPRSPRGPARPLRVVLGTLAGFVVDVALTTLLATTAMMVHASVGAGLEYPVMDLSSLDSLRNPWAVVDLLVSGGCSVLGGYIAARIARRRAVVAYLLLITLHVTYGSLPEALFISIDWAAFARSTLFNWLNALLGVVLAVAALRASDRRGDSL